MKFNYNYLKLRYIYSSRRYYSILYFPFALKWSVVWMRHGHATHVHDHDAKELQSQSAGPLHGAFGCRGTHQLQFEIEIKTI